MSAYCAPEDLGRLAVNRQALENLSNEEDINPAIESASSEVDSFFKSRFTLPLTSWDAAVRRCCAVIAAWIALTTRGWRPGDNPEDQAIVMEVERQRKWLVQVSQGTATPTVTDSSSGSPTGAAGGRPTVMSNEQRGFFTENPGRAVAFQGRRRSG
jgi:phage gp36-like protein